MSTGGKKDLTIDEVMALGETHTKAMKKKPKKVVSPDANKTKDSNTTNIKSAFNSGALGKQMEYDRKRRENLSSASSMAGAAYNMIMGK